MRLSSVECNYCGKRIAGTDTFQSYHIYKEHREKLRESYEKGYPDLPDAIRLLISKERGYEILLETMKKMDEREKLLT